MVKEEEERKSWLLSWILAVLFLILIILSSSLAPTPDPLPQCEHWVYDYKMRGRYNYQVMCGDSLIVNRQGKYKPIPPYLEPLRDDINKQYRILIERKNTAKRQASLIN